MGTYCDCAYYTDQQYNRSHHASLHPEQEFAQAHQPIPAVLDETGRAKRMRIHCFIVGLPVRQGDVNAYTLVACINLTKSVCFISLWQNIF